MTLLSEAVVYTDGSSGQSGNGGWAAIVATPIYGIEISGWETNTTNNRMELIAAIKGMRLLHEPHDIKLVSDSAYLLNSIKNQWYYRWFEEQNNARPNIDLWREIERLICYHVVTPIKVKGHSGVEFNEEVDKLAVYARKEQEERFNVLYGNITEVVKN